MAFIYYQDETILGLGGGRFLQGAVLVRPSFLISSSPESTISKDPLSKTMLARLGATVIDHKFPLNEDEDEQEHEVIQITQPSEHDSNQWWLTDICLLKTLQPIVPSNAIQFTQLSTKQEAADKLCHILIYKKKSGTDVRVLTRLFVEMLPPSADNCGEHFVRGAMTCAADQITSDGIPPSTDFCQGNNGGPLICDNDVIALQTYIKDDCKAPHLYQLLSPRKQFLDCGIDEKCGKEHCQHVCSVIQKDAPPTPTQLTETTPTEPATTESPSSEATTPSEPTKTIERMESTETYSLSTSSLTTLTTISTSTIIPDTSSKSWPNERDGRKVNDEETDVLNRTVSVEAKSAPVDEDTPERRSGTRSLASADNVNLALFQSLVCYVSILILS
ncbi:ovochymase-1-like [Cydia strobilella]|uniref:ovochymase-1-like n=1 Tax=Cydia strobilella TaxID=1100964 RepID=UPI003005236C